MFIETERLIIKTLELNTINDILNKVPINFEVLGYKFHSHWPTADAMDIMPIVKAVLDEIKNPTGYEFWVIIRKIDMTVIGDIGFKGQPNEKGEIEVGYGLVEEVRGQGYGFEALKAIINWAFSQEEVKIVKAETLLDNIPSIKILQKVGMLESRRDNEFVYWELKR